MKIEAISLNVMMHRLSHATAAGVNIELAKKDLLPGTLKYIEDYCNAKGYEVMNVSVEGNCYIYHLIKR